MKQKKPPARLWLRLVAGKHAARGGEVEIHVDGARIAGGYGVVEFDLFAEGWVEIVVLRP